MKYAGLLACRLTVIYCLVFGLTATVSAQASAVQSSHQLMPGVFAEKIASNSEPEKADMREGDVMLSWSRGEFSGRFESPFDVRDVEIEQAAIAPVTIEGLRNGQPKTWVLGQQDWALKVRPNFGDEQLRAYQALRQIATAGNFADVAAKSQIMRTQVGSPHWLYGWLMFRAGELMETARHFDEADKAYGQALEAEKDGPVFITSQILWARGNLWFRHSDWDAAVRYFEQALAESRKAGDDNLVTAISLYALGLVKWRRDDLKLAEMYHRQALAIREKLAPNQLVVAKSLNLLGNVMDDGGNIAEAERVYRQSLEIRQQRSPNSMDVASSLTNLAVEARRRGDLTVAEGYARRAFAISQRLSPDSLDVATVVENLGPIVYDQGDLDLAQQYFNQALSIRQKLSPEDLNVAVDLHNLGSVALDRGDFGKAEDLLNQALAMKRKLVPSGATTASSLNMLGRLALQKGDLALARDRYREALSINQQVAPRRLETAEDLFALGTVFQEQGDLKQAEDYYQQARSIREDLVPGSRVHAESLAALARIKVLTQQPEAAASLYEQALHALESQADRLGGSEQGRSGFRAGHGKYYREYIDLLVSQKQPERALDVLEHSRSRILLETLANAHVDIHRGAAPELLTQERSLRADINAKSNRRIEIMGQEQNHDALESVQKEIAALLVQYEDVEARIRVGSPNYAALTQPQPLTAKDIQRQLLGPDTLLLEYSLGEERSYVFAVTPDSLEAFTLPKRAVIEKAARDVYRLLTERNRMVKDETSLQKQARLDRSAAEYRLNAEMLSRMLLGPVAAQLHKKRLLIVNDGALAYIPFAVLPEPHAAQASTSKTASLNVAPLVVNHEIVNLPSASVLAVLRQQQKGRAPAPKAVAVLADPVFDRQDPRVASSPAESARNIREAKIDPVSSRRTPSEPLPDVSWSVGLLTRSAADVGLSRDGQLSLPRLLFSRREADAIMSVVPPGAGKKAVDFDASRATATSAELSQYRIVHFATHGLLDSVHPELSGLVFSMVDKQGHPQNGFLELQDIYNLNLPADLVVLSACETGLGKEISGEGLVGLTRGFMHAGASRVMASLWKVSDAGTATLMANFYTAMQKEHLPPAAALRAAQIRMWEQKRWHDPYYWAAFQIQGEWK